MSGFHGGYRKTISRDENEYGHDHKLMVKPSFCELVCIAGQLALQVHGSRSGHQRLC